jgi:alkylation response protein AidB-like acyl-CoA dehydrogenase
MDFTLSEEQQLFRDAVAKFVQNEYAFEARKRIIASAQGWSAEVWAKLAEMGVLGVPFAEADGGLGGSGVDLMVVMQELGRGIVVEPYLATVVLGGGAVAAAGSPAQRQALLPGVIAGERQLALAYGEPESRHDLHDVQATARRDGAGYVLSGRKAAVLNGATANTLVVSARTAGARRDAQGVTLFLVERGAQGVSLSDYRTIDGLRAADLVLDGVRVDADAVLGPVDGGLAPLERAVDLGAAALCAEAVGVIEQLNALTLDYLRTRQQFGQPIGRFQALQHRAVDMLVHAEQVKSIVCLAASAAQSADERERRRAVSAAKSLVGRSGRAVAKEATQLHGGMGVTLDLPAAHYAKRLTMIDFWLGDSDWHTERFAAASA